MSKFRELNIRDVGGGYYFDYVSNQIIPSAITKMSNLPNCM